MGVLAQMLDAAVQTVAATPTSVVVAFISVTLSVVATLVWVLRHQFLTTIPAIQAQHDKSREVFGITMKSIQEAAGSEAKAQRESNEKIFGKLCDTFTENVSSERKMCQEQGAAVNQTLTALTSAIREMEKGIVAGVNAHTTAAATEYRHDIRNMVQEGIYGKEVWRRKLEEERATTPPKNP